MFAEPITIREICTLTPAEKETLFAMYVQTYRGANQPLWFHTAEDLFQPRYKWIATFSNAPASAASAYVLLQARRPYGRKISVVAHDGTPLGKERMIALIILLLEGEEGQSGPETETVLEASGAVSWVLRKRRVPMILEKHLIEAALGISPNNPNDYIVMNPQFDVGNKYTQSYTRMYTDLVTKKQHVSEDTLFSRRGRGGARREEVDAEKELYKM